MEDAIHASSSPMVDRYAVIGNPIAHSKSPHIHQSFAAQTRQNLTYKTILAPLEEFSRTVHKFQAAGGKGLNVTVPFKEQAWELCHQRTQRAQRAGAVNTIWFEQSQVCGDNTDGIGLIRDLQDNAEITLRNKNILLIGAGGAARGVLTPVLDAGPSTVVIVNRTVQRAMALAAEFADPRLCACGFTDLGHKTFDIVINASSAGLEGLSPPLPFTCMRVGGTGYDMVYANHRTPFLHWAYTAGATHGLNGIGMLVEQAAEAFFRWRGIRPLTRPVIAELRSGLPQKPMP